MTTPIDRVSVSDLVSAFLKGITVARAKSDRLSGGLGAEYLSDDALTSYPVPRMEIRQAEVNMKFAVLETADQEIDEVRVIEEALIALADELVAAVGALPTRAGPDDTDEVQADLQTRFGAGFEPLRQAIHDHITNAVALVELERDALMDAPARYARTKLVDVVRQLLADTAAVETVSVWLDDKQLGHALEDVVIDWVVDSRDGAQRAVEFARAEFFDLQLAVKRDQLESLPEHMISDLKLTFEVDNYVWTTTKVGSGQVSKKLTRL